jgi:integrase
VQLHPASWSCRLSAPPKYCCATPHRACLISSPKLLYRVRAAARLTQYSARTEDASVFWIRRFILFHGKQHPATTGAPEVRAFHSHLATDRRAASSTQNQALSALLFVYRRVLEDPLPSLEGVE